MAGGRTFKIIFDAALGPELASAVGTVEGKLTSIDTKAQSTGAAIAHGFQVGSVAISAAAVGIEAYTRSQQEMNTTVGQTAAAMGISEAAFRDLATSISNAGLPLKDTVELMKLANQEGLKGDAVKAYANFWDDVGDATGKSATALAAGATGLRAVGVAAGNEGQALAAFGFITDHTKLGVDDFLSLLQKKGSALHDFGISIDDTAAVLGVMEKSLGLTGKAAATQFASALEKSNGSLGDLLRQLGITPEQFDAMRQSVEASSGVIERNAQIQDDTITTMQRWQQQVDEFLFSHADLVRQVADIAPLMLAVGPAVNGVTAAYRAMSTEAGIAAIKTAGVIGGLAALTLAADAVVSHFGGVSIFDVLLGDPGGDRRHEKYANDVAAALIAAGSGADKSAVAMKGLAEASDLVASAEAKVKQAEDSHDWTGLQKARTDLSNAQTNAADKTTAYSKILLDEARAMKDPAAAAALLKSGHDALLPSLQGTYDKTTLLNSVLAKMPSASSAAAGGINTLSGSFSTAAQAAAAALGYLDAFARSLHAVQNVIHGGFSAGLATVGGAFDIAAAGARLTSIGDAGFSLLGSSGGGGGGGGAAAAKVIVQSFADAMAQELANSEMEKEFGNAGGRVLEAFGAALADPTKGNAIAPAIASLITQAENANVPNAAALGANLINAVGDGLQTGDWNGIYSAMHALADSLSPLAIEQQKAAADIAKSQAALADAFATTEQSIAKATAKEALDLQSLATSHQEAMDKISASLAKARADYAEAAATRAADYAEARSQRAADAADSLATRHADAADSLATRHQDAQDAAEQRHADSADRLAQMASDHEDRLQKIQDDETKIVEGATVAEVEAKLRAQQKKAAVDRAAEEKQYAAAVAAEQKKVAKADAAAAAAMAKQDAAAEKALAKQDAAAAKSLAKQEDQSARSLAKQEEAAAKAEAAKEKAINESFAAEDKKYADQQETVRKRYADELKALQEAYSKQEAAANAHMATMAAILNGPGAAGTPGHMRPVTIDWNISDPNSPAMRWDSANMRWVDTGHMPLPGYESGTDFVPSTGPAIVHRGERIVPAAQNRGGGPQVIHIHGDWRAATPEQARLTVRDVGYHLRGMGGAR